MSFAFRTSTPVIKIGTYNIHGNHHSYNENNLISVLRSANLDIIALQEVWGKTLGDSQAHSLSHRLGMPFCIFIPTIRVRKGVFGNAIISRLSMTSHSPLSLPRGSLGMPGSKEPRCCVCASVAPFSLSQFNFLFLSTHFGIYDEKDMASSRCVEGPNIIAKFVTDPKNQKKPALLCGDMNAVRESPVLEHINKNWNIYQSSITTKKLTIDYICDRGRGLWKMVDSTHQVVGDFSASDHRLVVAHWYPVSYQGPGKTIHVIVDPSIVEILRQTCPHRVGDLLDGIQDEDTKHIVKSIVYECK